MDIRRAIPIVNSEDLDATRSFYADFLGFEVAMDETGFTSFYADFLGFEVAMDETGFTMFRSASNPTAQVIAGSRDTVMLGPPRPQMTVEVADVDAALEEAEQRGLKVVYPIRDEPWGVRRFFVEDPDGNVVNVAAHIADV